MTRVKKKVADTRKTPGTPIPHEPEIPGPGPALRNAAERELEKSPMDTSRVANRTQEELIHELEVHQIELEMQADELKRTYLALEESRDKYLNLYEFAPVGYLTLTEQGIITGANLSSEKLLGLERRKIGKAPFSKFLAEKCTDRWYRYLRSVLGQEGKKVCTFVLKRGDGSEISVRCEGVRILDADHGVPEVRVAISDISDLKRTEDALRASEAKLRVSLEEKDALLSEVHHRVKNNLAAFMSLLSLDGSYEDSDAGKRLRIDLQNRARSMALIHETLYNTGTYTKVDMDMYLSTLTSQVANTYRLDRPVLIKVDAHGLSLDLRRTTPCGLIVNELITNAFKYAFPASSDCETTRSEPCTLRLSFALKDGEYTLSVSDNGIGLPEAFNLDTAKSLGLKLVKFLSKHQLRATVQVLRENGTEFRIRFRENDDISNG